MLRDFFLRCKFKLDLKKKKKIEKIYGKHKRCLGLKLIMRFGQGVELKNEIRGKSII